jgi:hypothetical protein
MKTLQEHYNAIKTGTGGNKAQFLKIARQLFPEYINQYSDFDTATSVLKSKQIISEAKAGGVVSKGFDIYDWKKILSEEAKAEEKSVSKEVEDYSKSNFNNKDMKNADNINFNEIMKGFYAELKDEKNAGKTGDEIKDIVVKNLAKDALYYTKDGEFGVKGVGYTDEAPGLGKNTQPKTKEASVLGGNDKVDSDSEVVKNSLVGSAKKNVKDTLSNSEAKDSMPKKVKEIPDKGVTGVEKKIKLQEGIEEAMVQGTIINPKGGGDGEQKAPRAVFLSKEVIDQINNKFPGSIKLVSKGKNASMFVSQLFAVALGALTRGRYSPDTERKKPELAKFAADLIPSLIRGKIKSTMNPKPTGVGGEQMHYVGLNLVPKKDGSGYWIPLKGEFDPLVTENESKLRSIIRNIIKEELVDDKNIKAKNIITNISNLLEKAKKDFK